MAGFPEHQPAVARSGWSLLPAFAVIAGAAGWSAPVQGQTDFGPERIIVQSSARDARDVAAADLDGDGDPDLLSASYGDGKIAWYPNSDGRGGFGRQRVIDERRRAHSVVAADLDGDGDLDVLGGFRTSTDGIVWYENLDGRGRFDERRAVGDPDGPSAVSVVAVDMDGDGDMDILAVLRAWYSRHVVWYENDGSGHFGPYRPILSDGPRGLSAFAVDWDQDGDVDVLCAGGVDDSLFWYENLDGAGFFGLPRELGALDDGFALEQLADLDGDGDEDFVVTSTHQVAWYENRGEHQPLGPLQVIMQSGYQRYAIHAADLDGDGDEDVLAASDNGQAIVWLENKHGSGTFAPQRLVTRRVHEPQAIVTADLDGDGDRDIAVAGAGGRTVSWVENTDGLGRFGVTRALFPTVGGVRSVHAADMDGDGDLDVLSASPEDDMVAWYENVDGLGGFGPQRLIADDAESARFVRAADFDGDGDLDVLALSADEVPMVWYENSDGLGTFASPREIAREIGGTKSAAIADLDGDGDLDVMAWAGYYGYSPIALVWLENEDGQGTFGARHEVNRSPYPRWRYWAKALDVADLDGDGDPDAVTAYCSSYDYLSITCWVGWYENSDGRGTMVFRQVIRQDHGWFQEAIAAADFDGDGDLDVIAAPGCMMHNPRLTLTWQENLDGLGSFAVEEFFVFVAGYSMIEVADLDGDDHQDLLINHGSSIVWWPNTDGDGTFRQRQRAVVNDDHSSGLRDFQCADLDGDGDQDVLAAFAGDDKVVWYENRLHGCAEDGRPCDFGPQRDGDWCNSVCSAGVCVAGQPRCDDGRWCNGAESCDPAVGCVAGAAPACDDGLACTRDGCDEVGDACVHEPDHALCDDGLFCNGAERCDGLAGCLPAPAAACDDGVDCTVDECDEEADSCSQRPDDGLCDDGLWCNGTERCDALAGCLPGPAPDCDDGVRCTVDECDAVSDSCSQRPDDGLCDDGRWCNGAERCDAQAGCVAGAAPCPAAVCDEGADRCPDRFGEGQLQAGDSGDGLGDTTAGGRARGCACGVRSRRGSLGLMLALVGLLGWRARRGRWRRR